MLREGQVSGSGLEVVGGVEGNMVGWRLAAEFLLSAAWVEKIWASRVGDACIFLWGGSNLKG